MGKPLVLIVEDQVPLQEMLETVVDRLLSATTASVDQSALVVEKVRSLKPALVMMDTAIPGGTRVLTHLKDDSETRHVPVVAVSTRGWMTCAEALEAGYDAWIGDGNVDRLEQVARQFLPPQDDVSV